MKYITQGIVNEKVFRSLILLNHLNDTEISTMELHVLKYDLVAYRNQRFIRGNIYNTQ